MSFSLRVILSAILHLTLADNVAQESFSHRQAVLQPKQLYGSYSSGCRTEYDHVSVVKQVPSFSKHCTKVDETKCKTIFKNSFTTKMETQCAPTFDTSCNNMVQTAYKQDCKIIKDIECRIVNLEDSHGGHASKKICEDVPTEKCVPVPVKVEGNSCVNVPTQSCQTVPVVASNPVPQKQCFKKPRKVCQTLVTTKPKVVTARIPKQVCDHSAENHHIKQNPTGVKKTPGFKPASKIVKSNTDGVTGAQVAGKDFNMRRADDLLAEEAEARSSDYGNLVVDEDRGMFVTPSQAKHFL